MRNFNKIMRISLAIILLSIPLYADAPYEKFHVSYKDISKQVLKDTIGILTISSDKKKPKELKTYLKQKDQFIFEKILKLKETIPISNTGYHHFASPVDMDSLSVYAYRYPIVASFGEYLCVVYNPIKNLRIWINIKELEVDFEVSTLMLEKISSWDEFIDIFCFTESERRKVYKEPRKDSDYFILPQRDSLLKAVDQKDGFIKIGIVNVDFDTYEESIEPIGWIRIRDDQGMLMLWVKLVDLC